MVEKSVYKVAFAPLDKSGDSTLKWFRDLLTASLPAVAVSVFMKGFLHFALITALFCAGAVLTGKVRGETGLRIWKYFAAGALFFIILPVEASAVHISTAVIGALFIEEVFFSGSARSPLPVFLTAWLLTPFSISCVYPSHSLSAAAAAGALYLLLKKRIYFHVAAAAAVMTLLIFLHGGGDAALSRAFAGIVMLGYPGLLPKKPKPGGFFASVAIAAVSLGGVGALSAAVLFTPLAEELF